jgi:hypothetical protein
VNKIVPVLRILVAAADRREANDDVARRFAPAGSEFEEIGR